MQEKAAQERTGAIDAELAQVKETFALVEDTRNKLNAEFEKVIGEIRALVEAEMRRQEKQKRDDRDHLEKMLEVQQKAHHEAEERSEQLWCHLLDQLKK